MQKLVLDDFFDEEFILYAIHSSAEDYKLAFFINKFLNLQLKKRGTDLDLVQNKKNTSYPIFEFENEKEFTTYYLVGNTCTTTENKTTSAGSLFAATQQEVMYLLPELKKADYFLKIATENASEAELQMVKKLNQIPLVVTAYQVEYETLKSKKNLNFD